MLFVYQKKGFKNKDLDFDVHHDSHELKRLLTAITGAKRQSFFLLINCKLKVLF